MGDFFRRHKKTKWAAITLGSLLALLVLATLFFDWNLLRPTLARVITEKTGRQTTIDGNLRVHLWSWNPSADIERVKIRNPDWAQHKMMFTADRMTVSVNFLRLLRFQVVVPRLEIIAPTANLERDARGRASWELGNSAGKPPKTDTTPTKLPSIQKLVIEDGKINLDDTVRKLKLAGTLVAHESAGNQDSNAFRLTSSGSLNDKPFKLEFNGGPLINITPDTPYGFSANISASDLRVDAKVSIPKPFDLSAFQAKVHFSGKDLADAYYLTALALPNTAPFDVAATVDHDGTTFRVEDLQGRIGGSDLNGKIQVDTGKERMDLKAQLTSKNLDFADLAPTLGAPPVAKTQVDAKSGGAVAKVDKKPAKIPGQKLLPDADLQLNRVRGMDADVTYKAASVISPQLKVKQVNFHLKLVNGDLKIDPLSFALAQGRLAGHVEIDARTDSPVTDIDMRIEDVNLGQFKAANASEAPISGTMQGRIKLHGSGSSMHKLASHVDGGIGIAVPNGEISDVIAELTGINVLRGLGLLISKDQKKTEIRCGVIDLHATDGLLEARTLYIDTTNVLITGRGNVKLQSEDIDMSLQGDPKKIRFLRLRSPISLHGTLDDPGFGIKPAPLIAQTGIAVALGTFLTPFAAALAFIDPGLGKDKNCASVISDAPEVLKNP